MQTYTYKRVGDLEIKANVYRADDDMVRPVVVWIHGGALIMGGREGVNGRIKKMFLDAGYAIVSIDYRLAPETKLPAIIEDIEDAFKWIREKGPELFNIDSGRIAVLDARDGPSSEASSDRFGCVLRLRRSDRRLVQQAQPASASSQIEDARRTGPPNRQRTGRREFERPQG